MNTPDQFKYLLNELIIAIYKNKKKQKDTYYAKAEREARKTKGNKSQETKEEEQLKRILLILKVLDEGDEIISHSDMDRDPDRIRRAQDLYNQAVQHDNFNVKELSIFLGKKVNKSVKVLEKMLSGKMDIQIHQEKPEQSVNQVQFTTEQKLSPEYLKLDVAPWIYGVTEFQYAIDSLEGRPKREIRVLSISQHSPITISIDGIADALRLILELIVPWRSEHAEVIAYLEVESRKAETSATRARAEKDWEEAHRLFEESRRIGLETDASAAFQIRGLTDAIINKMSPDIQEQQLPNAAEKLSPIIKVLALSPLEVKPKKTK